MGTLCFAERQTEKTNGHFMFLEKDKLGKQFGKTAKKTKQMGTLSFAERQTGKTNGHFMYWRKTDLEKKHKFCENNGALYVLDFSRDTKRTQNYF